MVCHGRWTETRVACACPCRDEHTHPHRKRAWQHEGVVEDEPLPLLAVGPGHAVDGGEAVVARLAEVRRGAAKVRWVSETIDLRGRDFLAEKDFSAAELTYLMNLAEHLKRERHAGHEEQRLNGRGIALIFEKTSTRTRVSFEAAIAQQGGFSSVLDPTSSQIGHKESTADTARVLSRVFDAIEYRGADHATVVELAQHATVPVFNGLTDKWHPTQTLADFMTMREHAPSTTTSFAYVGDARFNMGNSLLVSGAILGSDVRIVAPQSLWPAEDVQQIAWSIRF